MVHFILQRQQRMYYDQWSRMCAQSALIRGRCFAQDVQWSEMVSVWDWATQSPNGVLHCIEKLVKSAKSRQLTYDRIFLLAGPRAEPGVIVRDMVDVSLRFHPRFVVRKRPRVCVCLLCYAIGVGAHVGWCLCGRSKDPGQSLMDRTRKIMQISKSRLGDQAQLSRAR